MVRPTISHLDKSHHQGLADLLEATDQEHAVGWTWNPEMTLVALHEGRVVGMVAAWVGGQPYAFVDNLIVHPGYEGHGIGFCLALAIGGLLDRLGVSIIRVVTESDTVTRGLVKWGKFNIVGQKTVLERFKDEST